MSVDILGQVSDVSDRVAKRVRHDFRGPDSAEELLRHLARVDLSERVQAAIVLYAAGSVPKFFSALQEDWCDVLVNAGLEHEDWPVKLDRELGELGS